MSDMVERLRDARSWLNNGDCCGDKDSAGICAAPACIFGEALKELYEAADRIEALEAALLEIFDHECRTSDRSFIACTARDALWPRAALAGEKKDE